MEKFYFFDSNTAIGDRRIYSAADWSKVLAKFLENGIYKEGSDLNVTTTGTDMTVTVGTGVAFLDGHMYENDSALTLNVDAAEATLDRIDLVVLRLDLTEQNRFIRVFVKKGVAASSPVAPSVEETTFIKEIALAEVRVLKGQSTIAQSQITDKRPADFVDPFVDGSRITTLEEVTVPQAKEDVMNWVKGFGLGHTPKALGNIDLNSIRWNNGYQTGFYSVSSGALNTPLSNFSFFLQLIAESSDTTIQIAFMNSTNTRIFWRRHTTSTGWNAWSEIVTTDRAQIHKLTNDDGVAINFSGDLNTLTTPGRYYINGTATNRPDSLQGLCVVDRLISSNGYMQMFIAGTTGRQLFRYYSSGVWGPWTEYAAFGALKNRTYIRATTSQGQTIAADGLVKLTFPVEVVDRLNEFSNSTFTAKEEGVYQINVTMKNASYSTTAEGGNLRIHKNGTFLLTIASGSMAHGVFGSIALDLVTGDYIDVYVLSESNSSESVFNEISIARVL